MPLDTQKISQAAMEFMASLEANEEYVEGTIVEVGIVVHMRAPDGEGDTNETTPTYCTNDSRIYQTGMFRWAEGTVEWSGEAGEDPPEPPRD